MRAADTVSTCQRTSEAEKFARTKRALQPSTRWVEGTVPFFVRWNCNSKPRSVSSVTIWTGTTCICYVKEKFKPSCITTSARICAPHATTSCITTSFCLLQPYRRRRPSLSLRLKIFQTTSPADFAPDSVACPHEPKPLRGSWRHPRNQPSYSDTSDSH